jgi:hypothetical protein
MDDDGPKDADFYRKYLHDPAFSAPAPTNPASEPEPIRITGLGFSSTNGQDFAYNPPPQDAPPPSASSLVLNDFALYDAGGGELGVDNGTVTDSAADGGTTWLPTGMTVGATRGSIDAYGIAVSVDGYAWLEITIDDDGSGTTTGLITAVAIGVGATFPSNSLGLCYIPLGQYTVVSGVITVANPKGVGSQLFVNCGGSYISQPLSL